MAEVTNTELEKLMDKLSPVLVKAIQGDFSGRIVMEKDDPLNEVYAGVQTLLDVICEQIKVLEESGVKALPHLTVRSPRQLEEPNG